LSGCLERERGFVFFFWENFSYKARREGVERVLRVCEIFWESKFGNLLSDKKNFPTSTLKLYKGILFKITTFLKNVV